MKKWFKCIISWLIVYFLVYLVDMLVGIDHDVVFKDLTSFQKWTHTYIPVIFGSIQGMYIFYLYEIGKIK